MRFPRVLGALAAAAFVSAACAEQTDDTGDLDIPPAAETTPTPSTPAATDEFPDHTLAMDPIADSQVSGEVEIDEDDGRLSVDVQLTNSADGAVHKGHIHEGTCDAPGTVVSPLQDVTIGEDGEGTSENELDVPIQTLRAGPHIVAFHEANGNPGAPVVCAEIPTASSTTM